MKLILGKRETFLDKMEADIKKYESQNKTGNKVLDTVLTTKSLYCAKHNITFTCVADGTLLEFYGGYGYLQYFLETHWIMPLNVN